MKENKKKIKKFYSNLVMRFKKIENGPKLIWSSSENENNLSNRYENNFLISFTCFLKYLWMSICFICLGFYVLGEIVLDVYWIYIGF
jgi:hypothetical protein